jgi:hypothetical protein
VRCRRPWSFVVDADGEAPAKVIYGAVEERSQASRQVGLTVVRLIYECRHGAHVPPRRHRDDR